MMSPFRKFLQFSNYKPCQQFVRLPLLCFAYFETKIFFLHGSKDFFVIVGTVPVVIIL